MPKTRGRGHGKGQARSPRHNVTIVSVAIANRLSDGAAVAVSDSDPSSQNYSVFLDIILKDVCRQLDNVSTPLPVPFSGLAATPICSHTTRNPL
uniref:Uncharacterized protein n=1 Tax=Amphimedon queenslandica TaxID=400682 RepID=A0A1X7TLD9_AMPQE